MPKGDFLPEIERAKMVKKATFFRRVGFLFRLVAGVVFLGLVLLMSPGLTEMQYWLVLGLMVFILAN
jgi:hypothetical protein